MKKQCSNERCRHGRIEGDGGMLFLGEGATITCRKCGSPMVDVTEFFPEPTIARARRPHVPWSSLLEWEKAALTLLDCRMNGSSRWDGRHLACFRDRLRKLGDILQVDPKLLASTEHPALIPDLENRWACFNAYQFQVPNESAYLLGAVVAPAIDTHALVSVVVGLSHKTVIDARVEALTDIVVPPRQNFGVRIHPYAPQPAGVVHIYGWDIGADRADF